MEDHKTDVSYEQLTITVNDTAMVLLLSWSSVAHNVPTQWLQTHSGIFDKNVSTVLNIVFCL